MSCGADICTLRHLCGTFTGFEDIHSPWSCGASCWNSFDGWTDVKKKVFFGKKVLLVRTGPNSKLDGYFRTLDAFFRTFGRRPDGPQQKKVRLKKKRPLHVCVVWANLPRTSVTKIVRNWVLKPTLMRAIMKEQSASKNKSKEDRNHGIKHVNENQYFGNLCSCIFKQPKQNGTCNRELQVGNVAHLFDFHSFSCTSMSEHH